jgi:hypothetical protein
MVIISISLLLGALFTGPVCDIIQGPSQETDTDTSLVRTVRAEIVGADPFDIWGKVTDEDGAVVAGATVTAYNTRTLENATEYTDANGLFSIGIPNTVYGANVGDTYIVTAVKGDENGSVTFTVVATVPDMGGYEKNIQLGVTATETEATRSTDTGDYWADLIAANMTLIWYGIAALIIIMAAGLIWALRGRGKSSNQFKR